jgi:F-type H+-transporting ATPase subunit b
MKKYLLALLLVGAPRFAHAQEPAPAATEEKGEAPSASPQGERENEAEDPDPSAHFNFLNFSWLGKDEYGGTFGDNIEVNNKGTKVEEEKMSPPFVFLLLNFALLLWILGKYLLPAAHKMSADRHDQIKNALDEAAKLRDEAKAKLADYEKRIKGVDDEIKKLVDGIRADAEADKKRILEAAEHLAAQMKRDAELRIAAEIELARAQLTKEVTAAAVGATEKLLKDKATPDDQRKLVSSFIEGIN